MCIVKACNLMDVCAEDGGSMYEMSQMLMAAYQTTVSESSKLHS
jgi:hypothetical protein